MAYDKISQIFDDLTNYGITINIADRSLGSVKDSKGVTWTTFKPVTTVEQFEEFLSNGPSHWIIYNS